MKVWLLFCLTAICFLIGVAQEKQEILASANGRNYTLEDLPSEVQQSGLANLRSNLLDEIILEKLVETEAKARGTTPLKLLEIEIESRLPKPTEAEIKAFYDSNKKEFDGQSFEDVKPLIIAFLNHEKRKQALEDFPKKLKSKYQVKVLADVDSDSLRLSDVVAIVGNKKITFGELERKVYVKKLYIFNQLFNALEEKIFNDLVVEEAKARKITADDLIAQEVTNKLKDFSSEESEELTESLRKRLFEKYNVKFFLKEPEPFIQKISTDGSPSKGSLNAPIKVVMFSDFQCPACAAMHPILQKAIEPYSDKVCFVVRYFPLYIHKDAFIAAQAAHAAYLQGKFFEYIEILYKNQQALDIRSLKNYASQLGLDLKKFDKDMRDPKTIAKIKRDLSEGASYGVEGTPTVFVNGVIVTYDQLSLVRFRRLIEKLLKDNAL